MAFEDDAAQVMKITYRTPGTRVQWSNVAEWCAAAWTLDRRRWSRKARRDLETHAMCMPLAMIKIEVDLEAIEEAVKLLKYGPTGLQRPQRGHRGDHPTTAIIVALNNRAAVLRRQTDDIPTGGNWNAIKSDIKLDI